MATNAWTQAGWTYGPKPKCAWRRTGSCCVSSVMILAGCSEADPAARPPPQQHPPPPQSRSHRLRPSTFTSR